MFVYAKLPLEGPRKLVETGCLVTGNWDRVECVRKTSFFTVHPRCLCSPCIRFLLKINSKNIHLFSWWYQAEKGSLTALTSVFLCLAKLQRTGEEKLIGRNSKHIFGGLEAEGVVVTHLD